MKQSQQHQQQEDFLDNMFPDSGATANPRKEREAEAAPPPEKPAEPTRSLKLVGGKGRELGKAQKAFNRLVAKVERLRAQVANETARLDAAVAYYAKELHPLILRGFEIRKDLVRIMFGLLDASPSPFSKQGKKAWRALTRIQIDTIMDAEGGLADEDLKEIFTKLVGSSLEDARREEFDKIREDADALFKEVGADVDLSKISPDMSMEDAMRFQQEILEKMRQAMEADGGGGRSGAGREEEAPPRKKTKKQLEREAREQEIAAARKRSIGSIYKQLARAFHPDFEQDEVKKAEKEVLMKELTTAYKEGDLHTLLRLELEWIHHEEDDAERLSDEKLAIYNEVLKEQVEMLERELYLLPAHPRYEVLQQYTRQYMGYGFQPHFNGPQEKRQLEVMLKSMSDSLDELRGKNARKEINDMLAEYRAMMRREARMEQFLPDIAGFFDGDLPPSLFKEEDGDW
jgi:hypothetical protein